MKKFRSVTRQQMERRFRKEGGAIFYALLVEDDLGVMEEVCFPVFPSGAEEIELARNGPGIEREVFTYEVGLAFGEICFSKYFFVDRR